MPTVLLVEDDHALAELIAHYLTEQGYSVEHCARGDTALAAIDRAQPELAVLDVMLPGLDGLALCRQVRQAHPALPILILTARGETLDQIIGLECGADDYVAKPCDPRLLLARVRSLLRRATALQSAPDTRKLSLGQLDIDSQARQALWQGEPVELTTAEFTVLDVLARRAGEVLSRDVLVQELRGRAFNGLDRSVDVIISKLRKKFADPAGEPRKIKTVWGRGYLLVPGEWEL